MLGLGISGLWGKPYIGKPLAVKMGSVKIPILSDIPYVGEIIFNQDPYFYISVFLGIAAWFVLFKNQGRHCCKKLWVKILKQQKHRG